MKKSLKTLLVLLLLPALLVSCAAWGEYSGSEASSLSPQLCQEEQSEECIPDTTEETEPDAVTEPEELLSAPAEELSDPVPGAEGTVEAQDIDPVLGLRVVPALGSRDPVQGVVYSPDGTAVTARNYRVTLYVQLNQGDVCWVKPTAEQPTVEVFSDGSFALDFISSTNDPQAKVLHILLLPADYVPGLHDLDGAKQNAVDYVQVLRDENGSCTITPERNVPQPSAGKPSGLKVSGQKLAADVGFYTQCAPGTALSRAQLTRVLSTTAAFADTVRFYNAGMEAAPAYEIAHSLGLKVVGTAWLSGNADADRQELDALVEQCNKAYVSVACVGSETLLRGDLTAEQLIEDINYVRQRLNNSAIPVTTADTGAMLLRRPDVRNACDLLMPNLYPYWEGVAVEESVASLAEAVETLERSSPGKEIIISETGWPTAGQTVQQAMAGESQSAAYFGAVRDWSLKRGIVTLWFDAADEPWKRQNEGEAGAHWGLLTTDLALKPGYQSLPFFQGVRFPQTPAESESQPVSPQPVPAPAVTPTAITSIHNSAGGISLGWRKSGGAVRYDVYCKNGKIWKKVASTANTSLTVKTKDGRTALRGGVRYTFAVRSVGAGSSAALSQGKSLVYLSAPGWSGIKNRARGQVKAVWKRSSGASGYQLQYSTGKSFPKGSKLLTIAKAGTTSRTVKGLKKGKTYWFRLRSWRKVSGKKIWSAWGKAKKVKIKK